MTNLVPMAVATALLLLLGLLAARRPDDRMLIFGAAALAIVMAMDRGYYWNVFGRGTGFFTLNRVTALAVFATVLVAPMLARRD